ncbi:heparan-alpha-glucosaminide N-acetyltransferase [Simplicispira psychrophila]|uniref:heparan-alpha-glucosaminide N-acetyltransferase n=1 Tax=Simplicispira psychrophila TaxID=80882 RepID=UPI0004881AEA|nr:heparan-alpha-glucosaminide N-acetyltransferase [Simplicispira psychrophila]
MAHRALSTPPRLRFDRLDALRGLAMVWMTLFHFCFDLSYLGYWSQDFLADPVWTLQRTAIVSLFLFCAGLGQAVTLQQVQGWARFARRWVQIAGCALLVSVGSWWMFPHSFIYFGVLHGMVVMLLLARATAGWGRWLWLAGGVALLLPWAAHWALSGPWVQWAIDFNANSLNWLGLVSRKPFTEDYVPVLPWLGVMWWGLAAGQWLLLHRPCWLQGALPPALQPLQPLATLGRWSLSYYLLHQPVLLGVLFAGGWALGRAP